MSATAPVANDSPRLLHRVLWALLVIGVSGFIAAGIYQRTHRSPAQQPSAPLDVFNTVKPFELKNQRDEPVALADLHGQVWVCGFLFTRCGGSCPLIAIALKDVAQMTAGQPDVRFVAFSVDPENDSPAVLANYAKKMELADPRIQLLTGSKETIYRLSREDMTVAITANPSNAKEPITHSSRLMLIDAAGRVRGSYDGLSDPGLEALVRDIARLRAAGRNER